MLNRVWGILLIPLLCLALPVFAQEEQEPEPEDTMSSFVGIAVGVIEDKCLCPDNEEDLATFKRCLSKSAKKASDAFKKALRFTGESASEFKQSVASELDSIYDECEAGMGDGGEGEEEEPGEGGEGEFFPPPPDSF